MLHRGDQLVHGFQLGTRAEVGCYRNAAVVAAGDQFQIALRGRKNSHHHHACRGQHGDFFVVQHRAQRFVIKAIEFCQKAVDGKLRLGAGLQIHKRQRHHRHGAQKRGDHNKHNGPRKGAQHLSAHAAHHGHGHIHHHRGDGGGQHRSPHLARAAQSGFAEGQLFLPHTEAAFQHNNGVIHDHADGQDQCAACHHIQRIAHAKVDDHNGQQHRDGHTAAHDQAGFYIAKEQKQHRHGKQNALCQRLQHLLHGLLNAVGRGVGHLKGNGVVGAAVQNALNALAHIHGGGALGFGDGQADIGIAVVAADAAGILLLVLHRCHIRKMDQRAGARGEGDIADGFQILQLGHSAHAQILIAIGNTARRDGEICCADHLGDGGDIQPVLAHFFFVQQHLHIVFGAAAGFHLCHAAQLFQLGHHGILGIFQRIGAAVGVHRNHHGGHGVHAHFHDARGMAAVRQGALQAVQLFF